MSSIIILGCGYVGTALARHYLARGLEVTGLVRTPESAEQLAAVGIRPLVADLSQGLPQGLALAGAQVFHLAPPLGDGDTDPLTRGLVASLASAAPPHRILYMSTTGVYGDCAGAWVDETWPARPVAARSLRRWDAEESLRRWSTASGGDLVVLRVAGIYGPGRLPLDRIRRAQPLVRPEEAPFTNRIHVDDLVRVCVAAMERGANGAIYNACDGQPSTMTHYFLAVAAAAGLPAPPLMPLAEAESQLSAGMLSYLAESRRLSNRKVREELGVDFAHPTLASGLAASFSRPRGDDACS